MESEGERRDRQIVEMRIAGKSEGEISRLMGVTIGLLNVRRSVLINASPSRVWREFADPHRLAAWFGQGHTLYVFDKDPPGKSTCNGPCTNLWPPLMATADAKATGNWSVVTRDDGGKQWAYKDKPLYAHSKDTKPGDTAGEGFKDVWHVATR